MTCWFFPQSGADARLLRYRSMEVFPDKKGRVRPTIGPEKPPLFLNRHFGLLCLPVQIECFERCCVRDPIGLRPSVRRWPLTQISSPEVSLVRRSEAIVAAVWHATLFHYNSLMATLRSHLPHSINPTHA